MFVNTNVAAMNAWLNLSNTQNDMTNVLGQLSSGLKINSAADNPAGLAIAQQMQSEISGMNQAYQNSQTGINLFQTADSALGQIQSILQSMRSLASQAATGTNNSTDLNALQAEMNQYTQQITQITNDTNFNTLNLLGGGFANQSIQVGPDQGQDLSVSIAGADAYSLGVTGLTSTITTAGNTIMQNGLAGGVSVNAAGVGTGSWSVQAVVTPWKVSSVGGTNATDFSSLSGSGYTATTSDTLTINETGTNTLTVTDANTGVTSGTITGNASNQYSITANGSTFTLTLAGAATSGHSFTLGLSPTSTAFTATSPTSSTYSATVDGEIASGQQVSISAGSGALTFAAASQVNTDTSGSYTSSYSGGTITSPSNVTETATAFTVGQSGAAATSYTNGTGNATASTGIDITSQADAQAALTVLGNAINTISNQRANIGAYQNRLQFAASDLQVSSQNLTSARAQIMDADIAQGMSQLTRDQILQQAGVGMLAQANSMPQALLKLIP